MIRVLILLFNFCLGAYADQCARELRFNLERVYREATPPALWLERRKQLAGSWFTPSSHPTHEIRYQLYSARHPSSKFIVQFLGLDSSLENTARDSQFLLQSREHVHVVVVELRGQGATWINEIVNNGPNHLIPKISAQSQLAIAKDFLNFVRTPRFWQNTSLPQRPELEAVSTFSYSAWLGPSLMLQDESLREIGFDLIAPGAMSLDKLYAPTLVDAVDSSYSLFNSLSFGLANWVREFNDSQLFETGLMKFPHFSNDRLLRNGASKLYFGIRAIDALEILPKISTSSKIRLVIPTRDSVIPRRIYLRYLKILASRPQAQIILVRGADHDLLTDINSYQSLSLAQILHTQKYPQRFSTIEKDGTITFQNSLEEIHKNLIFEN